MERATQVTILIFGVLNLVFAAVGLYMSVETFAHPGHLSDSQTSPFLVEAFYGMSALNLAFVLALAVSGFLLLRTGARAITFVNVVFVGEMVYFIASLWPVRGPLGRSMWQAYGIANVATTPQLIVGYPLIALIALNVARHRLTKRDRRVPDAPSHMPH